IQAQSCAAPATVSRRGCAHTPLGRSREGGASNPASPDTGLERLSPPFNPPAGILAQEQEHTIMPFRSTALAVALALTLPAHAAEAPRFIGDEIVVAPTRAPQKLSDTLAAATVLTRSDIEASAALDLPSLLQGLPGVEISQTGGFGSQAAIRLR